MGVSPIAIFLLSCLGLYMAYNIYLFAPRAKAIFWSYYQDILDRINGKESNKK